MISVVIPLYNKAHTIVNTLQTVFNQTYQNFEVVIVDDGSTDNGVQLIQERFDDSRIRIITQENAGVSVARNRGIDEAKGEWVAFLDADDEWHPDYLKWVSTAAEMYPICDMILTGRQCQNYNTKVKRGYIPPLLIDSIMEIDFFENPHVFAHISATCIRRCILEKPTSWNRFIKGQKYNEDFFFLFAIALHVKVAFVGKFLSVYNGNIEGQVTACGNNTQRLIDSLLFHNRIVEEYRRVSFKRTFLIFMKYEFRHIVKGLIKNREYTMIDSFVDSYSGRFLLTSFERRLFKSQRLNMMSCLYINYTKVIWRMHGYPITK